jgi:hypothetical protein
MSDRRTLRDIRQAYEGMKNDYQLNVGQWAAWFRFNAAATTMDPTYDTGPQRTWYPPITLPVLIGEYVRAGQNFDDDGLYQLDRLHLIFSFNQFFSTTMPDPDPFGQDHVNDRVGFDGRLFSVNTFLPRGRVADYFLTVSVDCLAMTQSDLDEDTAIPMFAPYAAGADG